MNVVDFLKTIEKQKNISSNIRLYIIVKNKHYFINDGKLKNGFDSKCVIKKNRDSVLSVFSKMTFLFDEIIRLRIIGYSNQNTELLYLLNLIPVNRKIRTFLDWKVFEPNYTREMSRLFEVRNDTVHCVSLDEVKYNPKNSIALSSNTGFRKFKRDLEDAWKKILQIYLNEQEKIEWSELATKL
jgi:hypothetical protein